MAYSGIVIICIGIFAKRVPDGWCMRKSRTNPSRRQQWVSAEIGVIEPATICELFESSPNLNHASIIGNILCLSWAILISSDGHVHRY